MKRIIFKPSPRLSQVWREAADFKYRILHGAVRSSKTFLANDVALREIQQLPSCNVLISGYSISSTTRNVLAEWRTMIDPYDRGLFRTVRSEKEDYVVINWRGLKDKKFYIRGAGKENDYKQIQGATFGYWLCDEWSRHTESFTDMAISRLSPPFAKMLATTNPDSPFHYVKTRFIDKEIDSWKCWLFLLDDNPSLSREYIESLKHIYSGVFYKRFILGQWCMAEGVIYDFFDEKQHTASAFPKAHKHVVGVDYGTGNPTVYLLFGVNYVSEKPKIWCEREYYYDSRAHGGKQKTDAEYSYDLRNWLDGVSPQKIIIDPSAASFKVQLHRDSFTGITDADNSVLDGIRVQARMLKSGQYQVGSMCRNTIKEYGAYSWDEKAQLKGIDQPLKENDHCKDAERYVLNTLYGEDVLDYDKLTKM